MNEITGKVVCVVEKKYYLVVNYAKVRISESKAEEILGDLFEDVETVTSTYFSITGEKMERIWGGQTGVR
jgi:hypothetical protein